MSRPRLPFLAAALVGGSLAITSATGFAAAKPKVLVLPYQHIDDGLPDDLGEQTTAVIAREVAHGDVIVIRADDGGGDAAPAAAAGPSDAPTGDPGAGSKAEALMTRAKDAMEESEFERALELFGESAKMLEDNGDAVSDLRLLSEAYLQMGVAYFRDGMEDEGDEMLNRVVHYDPERTLDAADYPPIFIRVFERARFNVLRRPRARIEVKAAPGSQVLFDGRNMGKAPVVLAEALPGQHWIRVERPGEPVRVKKLDVRSKRTIVVEFEGGGGGEKEAPTAAGVLGAISANEVGPDHLEQLKANGAKAGADFVMFGGIYKTDTAYQIRTALLSVKDGRVGRLVEIAFDLDMLTAEIEVYKLAEDARNQAAARKLTTVVDASGFVLAPGYTKRQKRRAIAGAGGQAETKMTTSIAAPPPIKPPAALYAESAPEPEKAPLAAAAAVTVPVKSGPSVVPKDEMKAGPPSATLAAATIIPKDEVRDDGEPDTWWIWLLVGVAAAGAAGAGGYFLVSGGSPDQGSLRYTW